MTTSNPNIKKKKKDANSELASASNLQARPNPVNNNNNGSSSVHVAKSTTTGGYWPKTGAAVRCFQRESSGGKSPRSPPYLPAGCMETQLPASCEKKKKIPNTEPLPAAVPQCTGPAGGTRDTLNIMCPRCWARYRLKWVDYTFKCFSGSHSGLICWFIFIYLFKTWKIHLKTGFSSSSQSGQFM